MRKRAWLAAVRQFVRERDLTLAYAAVVLGASGYVHAQRDEVSSRLVLRSSTNLENMRDHPLAAMVSSAVVVQSAPELWILGPLVLAYGESQRWVGRAPTLAAGALGHVGGSLFVSALIAAGLARGLLDPTIEQAPDVGVSYGLAAVSGLLVARVPSSRRMSYTAGLLVFWAGPLLWRPTFTDVGHMTALALGLGMGLRASRAPRRA